MRFQVLALVISLILPASANAEESTIRIHNGIWKGTMVCGDPGAEVAFSAARRALVKEGRISLKRGTPNRNRFEAWEGIIDPAGSVMIFGRYHWKTEKPLWFKGRIEGRILNAVGQRGPKTCEVKLTRMSAKAKKE